MLPSPAQLSLLNNDFSGSITTEFNGLSSLAELKISQNELGGNLDDILGGLTRLSKLKGAITGINS